MRATPGSSCLDVYADMDGRLEPGERMLVKTGLAMVVPAGYEVQVRTRSGLALKQGVCVLNSPGTVDSDYRGEVGVILINHGQTGFDFRRGDRVAQIGVYAVEMCEPMVVESIGDTERKGGYGHTGSR